MSQRIGERQAAVWSRPPSARLLNALFAYIYSSTNVGTFGAMTKWTTHLLRLLKLRAVVHAVLMRQVLRDKFDDLAMDLSVVLLQRILLVQVAHLVLDGRPVRAPTPHATRHTPHASRHTRHITTQIIEKFDKDEQAREAAALATDAKDVEYSDTESEGEEGEGGKDLAHWKQVRCVALLLLLRLRCGCGAGWCGAV